MLYPIFLTLIAALIGPAPLTGGAQVEAATPLYRLDVPPKKAPIEVRRDIKIMPLGNRHVVVTQDDIYNIGDELARKLTAFLQEKEWINGFSFVIAQYEEDPSVVKLIEQTTGEEFTLSVIPMTQEKWWVAFDSFDIYTVKGISNEMLSLQHKNSLGDISLSQWRLYYPASWPNIQAWSKDEVVLIVHAKAISSHGNSIGIGYILFPGKEWRGWNNPLLTGFWGYPVSG